MNFHTFILKESGELFVFGSNNAGELGLGDNIIINKPTILMTLMTPLAQIESEFVRIPDSTDKTIRQIVCGSYRTFILKESGELFVFGSNYHGQLGLGDNIDRNVPTLLMTVSPKAQVESKIARIPDSIDPIIRQIVCGNNHTFILKESGELFAFGRNYEGQLGLGDYDNRNVPTLLMIDPTIQQVVCGWSHTFILRESGELFAFGYNYHGELGLGDNIDRNVPTLLMTLDNNIISINGVKTERLKWDPKKYFTLSGSKKGIIKNFLLVCYYYKKKYNINMVKNMRHFIISLLF